MLLAALPLVAQVDYTQLFTALTECAVGKAGVVVHCCLRNDRMAFCPVQHLIL